MVIKANNQIVKDTLSSPQLSEREVTIEGFEFYAAQAKEAGYRRFQVKVDTSYSPPLTTFVFYDRPQEEE